MLSIVYGFHVARVRAPCLERITGSPNENCRRGTPALNTPPIIGQGATLCTYNYISQAIGVGVRYRTPVGPVRFDFGYNLNPTVYPNFVNTAIPPASPVYNFAGTKQASPFNVYFSIGQTF